MIGHDLTFHPGWWHKRGFSFEERFFLDANYRIERDRDMRRVLYEEYGHIGLGEKNPLPRPIMDSDLVAGEYLQAQLLGCEVSFFPDRLPYTYPMDISDEAILSLSPPDLSKGIWTMYDRQLSVLHERFGYVESCIDLHGVQNLALAIRGIQLFEDYKESPEVARFVISIAYETIRSVARAILQYTRNIGIGVSAAIKLHDTEIYLTSNCSCDMISESDYRRFIIQQDKKLAQEFRPFGIHHCGKTMQRLAGVYAELEPDFIEVGAYSDIPATLSCFPETTRINLRFSPVELLRNTKYEVRQAVQAMKVQASGHANTTMSVVGVDSDTPCGNIEAFVDAAN